MTMLPLPMRSFFPFATKRALNHSRAWWQSHHKQFTGTQVMVQDLVTRPSSLLIMPTATNIHTHTLATSTLLQVEYKTGQQSWLGLRTSRQMTGKCFISLKPLLKVSLPSQLPLTMLTKFSDCKTVTISSMR